MNLTRRLKNLEINIRESFPQTGCNVTLFIVIPEDKKGGCFDSDTYKPTQEEIDKYLKYLKESAQCRDCKGSCALDWEPVGFKNHTIIGENANSSPAPIINWMYCAHAGTPALVRRLMNGERTPVELDK